MIRLFLAVICLLVVATNAPCGLPRFEIVPLGVRGGEIEGNVSCYLLQDLHGDHGSLMIDAGSPVSGILKWRGVDGGSRLPEGAVDGVKRVVARTGAILLTHAHLDHVQGLALMAPLYFDGVLKGVTTPVHGLGTTLVAVKTVLFSSQVWNDFTRIPSPEKPVYRLVEVVEGRSSSAAGFTVDAVRVNHPLPTVAFFITAQDGSTYLHVGDTGATEAVWARARPLLDSRRLKALTVECSFDSSRARLARVTGHLTPALLVLELAKLAGVAGGAVAPDAFGMEQARALVPSLAPRLGRLRLLVTHIKPSSLDAVERELALLRSAGLSIEILAQGQPVRFQ